MMRKIKRDMNELYPVFLKVNRLNVLIIGAGVVGAEKLRFLLKSSPNTKVEVIAKDFCEEVKELADVHDIFLREKSFRPVDLSSRSIVIAATNDSQLNQEIYRLCRARGILVNVADNPKFCDFYLGGIVTKGDLKIAISTNGKSPTMAKRMRQYFEREIPNEIAETLENLNAFRKTIKGDFNKKVNELNELTRGLIE